MEAVKYRYTGKSTELFTKGKIYAKLLSLGNKGEVIVVDDENDRCYLNPSFLADHFIEVTKTDNPLREYTLAQEPLMELDRPDPVSEYHLFPDADKENAQHKGLRFNNGKVRYDLLHPVATEVCRT